MTASGADSFLVWVCKSLGIGTENRALFIFTGRNSEMTEKEPVKLLQMKTNELPCGIWHVVRQECRMAGEWQHEDDLELGELVKSFSPDGTFLSIFRPGDVPERRTTGTWSLDTSTWILSIRYDIEGCSVYKCLWDVSEEGAYIYFYDDRQHACADRDSIIDRLANRRQKVVKIM